MEKSYETITLECLGELATVVINRPDALNALNRQVIADLWQFVADVRSDEGAEVRSILITGSGEKAFAAGADIRELAEMTPEEAEAHSAAMQDFTRTLETLDLPVIGCVNGYALGGGLELALACDFIYATENARFGLPEVSLGLIPGFGGTVRLPQRVGPGLAKELIYTGRAVDAREAHRIGLVNAVFASKDDMLDAAAATCREIAAKSPAAVANAKRTIDAATGLPTPDGLLVERAAFGRAAGTEDARIGTKAFVAKQKPEFTGR
ncbi:enoyl-CoA hydratase-related protein [Arthrobacter sp. I2-34]|uniref:Enoyl-CoA hydratase-related protein n=1 Tax=Arthrobacter hankyongi TaxID=2904801 RepID=A0ABS9LA70_9MICC|nr:enoyl-CoA hydratase-related protein [Arthrobacter hankyongi]MCG2623581.1 enoyl-CoA hydratase-related protein [Arthrobacter hankyongi]